VVVDPRSTIVFINRAAERMFQCSAGDLVGQHISILIPERLRKPGDPSQAPFLEIAQMRDAGYVTRRTLIDRNGREIPVDASVGSFQIGESWYTVGYLRDVSERERIETRRDLQYAVSRVLADADSFQAAASALLKAIGTALGWDVGTIWLVDRNADRLRCVGVWNTPAFAASEFDEICQKITIERGAALPGLVWQTGNALWIPDLRRENQFRRHDIAQSAGLLAALMVPITQAGEVLGVLELFTRVVSPPDDDLLALLTSIGAQIGQFVERARAEEEARARVRQQAAVAELGIKVVQGADLDTLFNQAVSLAPRILGLEFGYAMELDANEKELVVRAQFGWEAEPPRVGVDRVPVGAGSLSGFVVSTGRPLIIDDIRCETRFQVPNVFPESAIISGMCVVVQGRECPFGTLAAFTTARRVFTADDIHFLQAIANVLGQAIDRQRLDAERARLFDQERRSRAEAERAAVERAAVLGQLAEGVVVLDPTGQVMFVNEAARRLVGVSSDAAFRFFPGTEGCPYNVLTAADGTPIASNNLPIVRALCYSETVVDSEERIRRADGTEIIVQESSTPVVADDGTRLGAVMTLRDVTAQRAFDQQKSEFIATVSHELRTPLTVIMGTAQLLLRHAEQKGTLPTEDVKRIATINTTAELMTGLVNRLIEVTRTRLTATVPFAPTPGAAPPMPAVGMLSSGPIVAMREMGLESVAAVIVDQCQRMFSATVVEVWLADREHKVLRLIAHRAEPELSPLTMHELQSMPFNSNSATASAARSGQPVEIRDSASLKATFTATRQRLEREGLRSLFAEPLLARDHLVGVLVLGYAAPHSFTAEERALNRVIGDIAAVAIDNARLYREAQDAAIRASETLTILQTLAESAPMGLAFLDREMRYVRINHTLAEMHGVPQEAHYGRTTREVLPKLASRIDPILRQVMESGRPVVNRTIHGETPAAPGKERCWVTSFYPVSTTDDQIIGVAVVVQEVDKKVPTASHPTSTEEPPRSQRRR
jgi:PAS domain S-box-containing protein